MALLKKVNPEWAPAENKGLKVGETIEITDYPALVRTGAAVLVDEDGNEMPMPGLKFPCPVCFQETSNLKEFTAHVDEKHKAQPAPVVESEPVKEEEPKVEVEKVESPEPVAPLYVAKAKEVKGTPKAK